MPWYRETAVADRWPPYQSTVEERTKETKRGDGRGNVSEEPIDGSPILYQNV
jgi:hypothetical protein